MGWALRGCGGRGLDVAKGGARALRSHTEDTQWRHGNRIAPALLKAAAFSSKSPIKKETLYIIAAIYGAVRNPCVLLGTAPPTWHSHTAPCSLSSAFPQMRGVALAPAPPSPGRPSPACLSVVYMSQSTESEIICYQIRV